MFVIMNAILVSLTIMFMLGGSPERDLIKSYISSKSKNTYLKENTLEVEELFETESNFLKKVKIYKVNRKRNSEAAAAILLMAR